MYNHMNNLPFIRKYDYRWLKEIRYLRGLTLSDMSQYMRTDPSTLGKLERQDLEFTIHYESRFHQVLIELEVTPMELTTVERLIQLKEQSKRRK